MPADGGSDGQRASLLKEDLALLSQCGFVEQRFERRELIDHNALIEGHLSSIAGSLLPGTSPERVNWRFFVLRDPVVTAFSFPDGTIYISSGMLALLRNDDQLAGVLAHEIAHVIKRDAFQVQREYRKKEAVRSVAAGAMRAAPVAASGLGAAAALMIDGTGLSSYLILANAGPPISLFVNTGYGIERERLADEAAVAALMRVGRDPGQIGESLKRMADPRDPEPIATVYTDSVKLRQRAADLQHLTAGAHPLEMTADMYIEKAR